MLNLNQIIMIKNIKKFSFLIGFIILFIAYSCSDSSADSKQKEVDELIEKAKEAKKEGAYSDPTEYFEVMVGLQTEIGQVLLEIGWDDGTIEVRKQMIDLSLTVNNNLKVLNKMTLSKNEYGIKSALIELFEFYNDLATTYMPNMCDAMDKMEEAKSEKSTMEHYTEMLQIQEEVSKRESELDRNFEIAQKSFSRAYGFDLKENPLQDAVDNM